MQKTLAIIKPHAFLEGVSGAIIQLIELNKFKIVEMKKMLITREQAQNFYAVHKERPFFGELVDNMVAGPVIVLVLEKENAVQEWRDLMGTTDPAKSGPGTIRRMFGKSISYNATHGSDSDENAAKEIVILF